MKKLSILPNENDLQFYISIEHGKNNYIIYTSEPFLISEMELLSLIKLCYVKRRNKVIGNKLMEIYKDSTSDRELLTTQRLKAIGIIQNETPTRTKQRNPKTR